MYFKKVFGILIFCLGISICCVAQTVTEEIKSEGGQFNPSKNEIGGFGTWFLGYGIYWNHYFSSSKKWQVHTQIGLAQYPSLSGYRSVAAPIRLAVNRNKNNYWFFYVETAPLFSFENYTTSNEDMNEVYFNEKVIPDSPVFPYEQIVGLGIGKRWELNDKLFIKVSAGPMTSNIFHCCLSGNVRVQMEFQAN
jgi:hypothetical protein